MSSRKSFLIFCIVLTAIPLMAGLIFSAREWHHHKEMEEALEKSLLHKVTIKTSEIIWIKKGREILYNDQYFDIKDAEEKGEYTVFTGLYDKVEKELKKTAGLLGKPGLPFNKNNAYKAMLMGLYLEPRPLINLKFTGSQILRYYTRNTSGKLDGYLRLPLNPPRLS